MEGRRQRMCLAIPAKIAQLDGDGMATVDILGVTRSVSIDLTPQAGVGDFVLVHAGFAIEVVDPDYAQRPSTSSRSSPTWRAMSCPPPRPRQRPTGRSLAALRRAGGRLFISPLVPRNLIMQPQNIHRSRTVDAGTMQNELAAFKDPKLARGLIESIEQTRSEGGATLMEVCGTHTVASRATASATSCPKACASRRARAAPCASRRTAISTPSSPSRASRTSPSPRSAT